MTQSSLSIMMRPTAYHQFFGVSLKRPLSQSDLTRIAQLYTTLDDETLWQMAISNKVETVVAEALQEALDLVPLHWQKAFAAASRKISEYLIELDRVSAILANQKISTIVLENGALARGVISVPGRFSFGDFDLLVQPSQVNATHKLLLAEGYSCRTGQDTDGKPDFSSGRAEYERMIGRHLLKLNIQISFVARKWVNPWQEPTPSELFNRSLPIPGSQTRILGAEDFLLQLCIHNASHGFIHKPGIRLHMDLDWYLRARPIDWKRFLTLVRQYKVQTVAFLALSIPKGIWNTPVPDSVLSQLRMSSWKENRIANLLARVDLLTPTSPRLGQWQYVVLNLLFVDDLRDLWRSVFPDRTWMHERYGFHSDLLLPYYHGRRLFDLALRRVNT